ncbi:hypothetical protein I6N95_15350 [Vagococcus sp. BWB3-3]|uniref:Uncharacterized protein n=1 Tax=Vagococcus allomyrinae TaxID=2794353 RepID=A0A940P7A8_9ENTE|nr:hypothetical protein [Vagococcus allomyrinae]MBP1042395.1 hypothetical protein [Vagococcus allomyrinae]
MKLFDKLFGGKKNSPKERNEIDNEELKELLANTALAQLENGKDYDSLLGTTVDFGYLFDITDHGIEALFKITTDKGIFYFAAQKQSVLRLNFTEDLFRSTTERFLELHPK